MRKIFLLMLSLAIVLPLAACGNSAQKRGTNDSPDSVSETAAASEMTETIETAAASEMEDTGESQSETALASREDSPEEATGSNTLVAYFSLAGEQYAVGVIEEGNTSIIAHMIADETGADLFEIEAENPYPQTHSELLDVSRQEMSENARPTYIGDVESWEDYDTVYLGYPNWWGDMPMIVYNFLESHDWSGKTVIPFCTHGGSGLSGTEGTIEEITGAAMMDGFAIPGETAQNDRETSKEQVTAWLKESGLIA